MSNSIYIVYKTTNLVNGKFYIGVHKRNNRPDYIGSGTILKLAIEKYGKEKFVRETIKEFDSSEKAFLYEKELITNDIINNPKCYNIAPGGEGGWKTGESGKIEMSINKRKLYKDKENHPRFGTKHSDETKSKMKKAWETRPPATDEYRNNMSKAKKGVPLPKLQKKCMIYGIIYDSRREAVHQTGKSESTIYRWINDNENLNCFSL